MKTGKHYFGMLTEEEQINFKQACDEQHVDFKELIDSRFANFKSFIEYIVWSKSSQGYRYWLEVALLNRTEQPYNNLVTFKRIFIYSMLTLVALSLLMIAYKAGYDKGRLKGFNEGRDYGTMEVQTLMGYDFAPAESIQEYENMIKQQRK